MMHPDEVAIDAGLVRRLVGRQFPAWASLPVRRVSDTGTDNALLRLGEAMVVRLPRRERAALTLEKECRWLPLLAPALPVPVPTQLGLGAPDAGYPFPWAIYRWLPGKRATAARIADRSGFARDLAAFIRALQQLDAAGGPEPGEHNFFRGAPLAGRDARTRESIQALRASLDADALTAIWDEALAAPAPAGPGVWLHGDLDRQNLLVDGGRLSGVIDFGALGVGDPAADAMVAWKVFDGESRELFRDVLEIDDATWQRSRGWALSQAVTALAYYTPANHPVLVDAAREWLAALVG